MLLKISRFTVAIGMPRVSLSDCINNVYLYLEAFILSVISIYYNTARRDSPDIPVAICPRVYGAGGQVPRQF